ncbi:MAG: FAD binding domain-containing protein [Ktedonobacteraceae bacterium]
MKAAPFDYLRPHHVSEVLKVIQQAGGQAKLLAGGQSLGPMLNLRLVRPALLIDVSRIEALRVIEERPDSWHFGSAVTHARIEDANGGLHGGAMLVEVARSIAYRGVRNRGTLGGSLAHADPAADWPLALAALGATIIVRNVANKTRSLPADDFMTMAYTTRLAEDEIIESVVVPKLSPSSRYGYFKFCRKTGEFPEASAAVVIDPQRRWARIFVGAISGAPRPLPNLAELAARQGRAAITPEIIASALAEADNHLDAIAQQMHVGAVSHALERAMAS